MLKALSDLAAVVRVLANDILQVKADSIIVNEDVMSNIRGDMIENINENVNSKFNTVDKRIDRLFQHLLSQESTGNKDVDVNSKKSQSKENDVPVVDLSQDEPKETYASKASSHAGKQKEDTKTKKDVLVVGTSISNNLDKRVCENLTDLTIDVATAYTVGPDIDAKYREKNFKKIVPEKLKNQKYETLVLQGGSIEITNINTKDESKEMHFQSWKNKVKKSSEEMFNLAEESITAYPDLKVIIVARIPRFDSTYSDPAQVKSQLSQYGNSVYHNMWMDRGCPPNIKIHDLGLDCYGQLKDKRYGIPGTRGFDGKVVDC